MSFGFDANIALEFHEARNAHPGRFASRNVNKVLNICHFICYFLVSICFILYFFVVVLILVGFPFTNFFFRK